MKKRIILTNVFILFLSLFLLLISCAMIVSVVNNNSKENELKQSLKIALEIFDENDLSKTANALHNSNKDMRVTIIYRNDGTVLYDTSQITTSSHLDRDEIKNIGGVYHRYSETVKKNLIYIAGIAGHNDDYYVRISIPEESNSQIIYSLLIYGTITLVVVLGLSIIVLFKTSKDITKPLQNVMNQMSKIVNFKVNDNNDIDVITVQIEEINKIINTHVMNLRHEKEKLEHVITSINQGFIYLSINGNVNLINDIALNIFDFEREEIINKNYIYLFRDTQMQNNIKNILEGEDLNIFEYEYDYRKYLVNINLVKYSYGANGGMTIFLLDVSDIKNIERMKKEFFANASHELKSPLTTIIGYQDMIKEGIITEKEEIISAASKTIKEAVRMNKIVSEMLELSVLETNYAKEITHINLKVIIEDIIATLAKDLSDKSISVDLKLVDMKVDMNYDDAYHLLRNLIDNAIKYNKFNGELKIIISPLYQSLTIMDTGLGISKENQSKVFERFYRVDKNRSKESGGTGLGLAIVKHIASNYQIQIDLESKLNFGTKITLKFRK